MDELTRKALIVLTRAALGRQDHAELGTLLADLEADAESQAAALAGRRKREDTDEPA